MALQFEDIAKYGVVLIPPDSPEYDPLLADIQYRLDNPVAGSRPRLPGMHDRIAPEDRNASAILVNRSSQPIVSMAVVWNGAAYIDYASPSVLLPFDLSDDRIGFQSYWNTILPGSKRYLAEGKTIGDNTDVRPPGPGEIWQGGIIGSVGRVRHTAAPAADVTLRLDGVFFANGNFVGPNKKGLWEMVCADADACTTVARLAREAHNGGLPAREILASIASLTDVPHRPPLPGNAGLWESAWARALKLIAMHIDFLRKTKGDDRTVYSLMDWTEVPVPNLRRLVTLQCQDLAQHGVVLIPPDSPEYDALAADIERRLNNPFRPWTALGMTPVTRIPGGWRDWSAILVNRSSQPIAEVGAVWTGNQGSFFFGG